jgi:serine/threonine protein kinase
MLCALKDRSPVRPRGEAPARPVCSVEPLGHGADRAATLVRRGDVSRTSRGSERLIGHYEILDLLGAGGMGMVYRARDRQLGRDVALKVLLPELANDPEALSRFEREVHAVARLSHPNILAIYEFEREGETVYAAMELLTGPTLRQRLTQGPLPPRKAVDAAVQIAHGLAAAHEQNLVHRDLKPENLAFTADGRVKILDFGLVREYAPQLNDYSRTEARPTSPGLIAGTVGYMSPEQLRVQEVDHRCDLFALGAVLHEMMTGRRAFPGETVADITSAILKEETKGLADSGVAVPSALDSVVRRCLEKNPSERFQSARDLAFALENATNAGVPDVGTPPAPRRGQWLRSALYMAIGLAAGVSLPFWLLPDQDAALDYQVRELTQSGVDAARRPRLTGRLSCSVPCGRDRRRSGHARRRAARPS